MISFDDAWHPTKGKQQKNLSPLVANMLTKHGIDNPALVSAIAALISTGEPLSLQSVASLALMGYVPGQDAETDEEAKELVRDLKKIRSKGLFSKLDSLSAPS